MTQGSASAARERASEEAATWLVVLAEAPQDAALRARFEAWRTANTLNEEAWTRANRAYALIGAALPALAPPSRADPAGVRPHAPGRAPRRRLVAGLAVALAACLALAAAPGALLRLQADYLTTTAEQRVIALPDGSRLHLGPESAVGIAFDAAGRKVRLLRGEAFFEVAADAGRPFQAAAGDVTATVLGTAFEMRRGEDATAVAVRHGHVRVDDGGAAPPRSAHLREGEWVRVDRRAGIARGKGSPEDAGDWMRGEFVARERPIGDILAALRRYYPGVILVRDDAFARRLVSGIYDLRHPEATIRGLAAAHGATVRRISPWMIVISAR